MSEADAGRTVARSALDQALCMSKATAVIRAAGDREHMYMYEKV